MTNQVAAPGKRVATENESVATDTTGNAITYTVPSGKTATLTSTFYEDKGGGETVQLRFTDAGGNALKPYTGVTTTTRVEGAGYQMPAGWSAKWRVSSAGACGDAAAFYIGAIEEV